MTHTDDDHKDHGPVIVITTSVLTFVALLFVIARIASRRISGRKLAVDDHLVVICIIFSILYVALSGVAVAHGAGRHVTDVNPADVSKAIYYTVIAFVPGVLSFTVPKFAVVILLAKILDPGPIHRRFMWVVCILFGLLVIGMLVVNFAQCTPAAAQWGGAPGTCWSRVITFAYSLTLGIASAMFDFYLASYPTVVLIRLNMGWKKKLGLASALGFGYCSGAVAVYKCTTLTGLGESSDFTYDVYNVILWTNVEADCVLIGACIPTLLPLIKKVFGASVLRTPGSVADRKEERPQIRTIGSSGKRKRRVGDTSLLATRDDEEAGSGGSGGPEMQMQQSSRSGDSTLRDVEGHVVEPKAS